MEAAALLLDRRIKKKNRTTSRPSIGRLVVSGYSFGLRRCGDILIEQLHEKGGKFLFVCHTCAEVFPF